MQKKGFEFSFAWLFAILIGAIIIFLAIYGVVRLIGTSRYQINTITAEELSIIFEPLETGLASGIKNIARLREETRIYDNCFETGAFGKQTFSLSSKLGLGNKWSEKAPQGGISVPNKYVFSRDIEEGKEIYFFSKPFEMPWKVSEVIFLSASNYCFVNAPDFVESEVLGLNLTKIKIGNCSSGDMDVCFGQGDCDIKVRGDCSGYECESEYDYGVVEKQGKEMFFSGSLMYGAILSSPDIYECNVKRLTKRLIQQALIFKDEADFVGTKCGTLPSTGLIQLVNVAKIEKSQDLFLVRQIAEQTNKENEASECKLW